jgi:DNA mismatch repair protein MSH6
VSKPARTAVNATEQAKKVVSYAELDEDDEDDAFDPGGVKSKPSRSRGARVQGDSEEEDTYEAANDGTADDDGKKASSSAASD